MEKIKPFMILPAAALSAALFLCNNAHATVWYVRDGGGTPAQCTGTTNAAYPGSGSNQPCAINDLAWVIGTPGAPALMAAGDTLNVVGDSDINPGQQAQYMVGYGMPNTVSSQCSTSNAYNCLLSPLPGGSPGAPTTMIGMGTHKPQIWGTQGTFAVLYFTNGNYDIENLEVTDHSPCSYQFADPNGIVDGVSAACTDVISGTFPYGTFAKYGIELAGSNITTKNLFVHRFAQGNIYFPGLLSNWSSTNDIFTGSGGGGALDNGGTMTFGGNNTMTSDLWAFGGCSEHYPDVSADPLDDRNYHHCADQTAGGYNLGGGFMMQNNGNGPCGNWTISNSRFLYNIKTNIDFLHCDGTGTFDMYRSRSEGSSGEAVKLNVAQVNLEEDQLIGNAPDWTVQPLAGLWSPADINGKPLSPSSYMICRGDAVTIFNVHPSEQINFVNDDMTGNCTSLIVLNAASGACTGSAVNAWNTKFIGGYAYDLKNGNNVDLFYNGGSDGNGSGSCGPSSGGCRVIPFNTYNSSVYNANASCGYGCGSTYPGTNTVCTDPEISGEQTASLSNFLGPTAYYAGTNLGDLLYLQMSSPLIGKGTPNAVYTNGSSADYNNYPANSPPDIGGLQLSSCAAQGGFCMQNSDCCSAGCSNHVCGTPDTTAPTVPAGLSANALSPTQIALTWMASTDPDSPVAGYDVYRNGTQTGSSATSSFTDRGLAPSTSYTYTVAAYDAAGNVSAQSAPAGATTLADSTAPSIPTGLKGTAASSSQINLSWNASTDPDSPVSGYNISRNGVVIGTSAVASYSDTGLAPLTSYLYTVSAYDPAGNTSGQSSGATVTTISTDTTAPSTPANLSATATATTVSLSWGASTDPDSPVSGYNVFRDGTKAGTSTATSYVDSGLTRLTTYSYTVSAFDPSGNTSAPSAALKVKTKAR